VKICVQGLWHLGSVTAASLAALGHRVVGFDYDAATVANLAQGVAPVFEPGLEDLIRRGLASGNLTFSAESDCLSAAEVLWVAYDTPVDDQDQADADWVVAQIERALPEIGSNTLMLISSQLPVGSVRRLEQSAALNGRLSRPRIAYCPENLRVGRAVEDFMHPDRIVVGLRSNADKLALRELLWPISESIEWMSVESAEMTKHAINAWFATSVAFINEIASICEAVGADAEEVERGLKSEIRIGQRPYLSPGEAFAGGTLAREIAFLNGTSAKHGMAMPLLSSVLPSNAAHRCWVQNKLQMLFPDLSRITVAIWGLTYKPNTDTLRRSASVELCDWLIGQGTRVRVHDPLVATLPHRWGEAVRRYDEPAAAARGAHALVIATAWPIYRSIPVEALTRTASPSEGADRLAVLDANRFVPNLGAAGTPLRYFAVGRPMENP
jgi:UDPglucose 6-dehydrogenase